MGQIGRVSRLRAGLGACLIALASGIAAGADEADPASRVAEARAVYEKALAELQAAEAELASAEAARAAAGDESDQPVDSDHPAEVVAKEPGFFDLASWDKSIDIGITGASGNSDNLSARVQISAERKTSKMESKASALYRLSQTDGDNTENRFRFDLSNDWLPPEGSKIRWWARGAYEYDEFQAWDHRVSASGGVGYELVNNDKHTLIGRLGLGGSQTVGDDTEEFRPEAVAGLDYAYQIKENQRFVAGTEILLDVSDTDFWRTNSFARYEAVIDPTNGMNFKTGITHRYDSEPGGDVEKSDFEYFATLGWTF
jgi:putative salt-induced outer membrane protein YdiY